MNNERNLLEFAKILGKQTNYNTILDLVAQKITELFKAESILILMLNPETRNTVKTVFKDGKFTEKKEYLDIHIHIGGWIIDNKKSFISENIKKDNRFVKDLFDNVPLKTVAGVPLIIEDTIIGALILLYKNNFIEKETFLLESIENCAAVSVPFLRNAQKLKEYFYKKLPDFSLIEKYKSVGLIGKSEKFVELLYAIEAATKVDTRVLLIGRTGTGKELIARAIHNFSNRASEAFVATDCGAIPRTLLESEFFGHRRGAFTGAHVDRAGLFYEAHNGTLFLDEINNLPLDMQAKLLRVLEQGKIRPVGGDGEVETNVRIIAASSTSLKDLVDEKLFREDLFYRLYVYPIFVPNLAERQEDIAIIANHFLKKFSKQQNKDIAEFHELIIDYMKQHNWEGNIRELENFIERIVTVIAQDIKILDPDLLPNEIKQEIESYRKSSKTFSDVSPLKEQMEQYEAHIIKETLIQCNWNQSLAARKLHTAESNIRYKMNHFNIKKSND